MPTVVPADVSPAVTPIVAGEAGISPAADPIVTGEEEILPEETPGVTQKTEITPTVTPIVTVKAKITPSIEAAAVLGKPMEVEDGLYFAVQPALYTKSGEDYRYVYYVEQEKVKAAYEKAMNHVEEESGFREGEESAGIYVMYQEEWWLITREGALVGQGRVEAEHAGELLDICKEAVAAVRLPEPVQQENIKGITSATLHYDYAVTITDKKKLALLEKWLSESEELLEGADCGFTSILTLELENGKQVNIAIATDSYGTWMSEGVFYRHANGNEELFELFEEQAAQERREWRLKIFFLKLDNFNWQRFIVGYSEEEAVLLLEKLRELVQENALTETQIDGLLQSTKGLDGAYVEGFSEILAIAYKNNEPLFAYCWSQLQVSDKNEIVGYLASPRNLPEEEVKKSLEENLGKFLEKASEQ